MASELNRNTIKTAIVAELKTNSALFTTSGENDKLRAIEVGRPEDEFNDDMIPYAFVRNARGTFETIEPQTIAVSDASRLIVHDLTFEIVVVVNEKNSRTAEALLDNLQELILETLEDDQDIGASVDTSDPATVADFPMPSIVSGKQGRIITIKCSKVTS